jgi:hypothetical protein
VALGLRGGRGRARVAVRAVVHGGGVWQWRQLVVAVCEISGVSGLGCA